MWGSWVNWMGSPVAILDQGDSHRVLVFRRTQHDYESHVDRLEPMASRCPH